MIYNSEPLLGSITCYILVAIVAVLYLGQVCDHFGAIDLEPLRTNSFDPVNVSAGSDAVCLSVVAAVLVPSVHEPTET